MSYKEILNLKSTAFISDDLADRQLNVITTGYDFLSKPQNNILYLADEVGLGKTYIANGISFLLRHFSSNPSSYKTAVIVPKKNLQAKWYNESILFAHNNYIKSTETFIAQLEKRITTYEKLMPIDNSDLISIYRMSSFSNVASGHAEDIHGNQVFRMVLDRYGINDELIEIIKKAKKLGYFKRLNKDKLIRLIGYMLNAYSDKIDCLIIDEAHNYKYGPSVDSSGSIRNRVTSCFLGAVSNDEIFEEFPELVGKIKFPLADKIICLSATPKDKQLTEIERQFSCFTNKHILSTTTDNKSISEKLNKFLIRGNMEYKINNVSVSRNQCRFEHRDGNLNRSETPQPISLQNNFEGLFWQLLQYKSLKHLNQKNNASFEIGMLAGFETYRLDADKKLKDETKEYELSDKFKRSQDANIVDHLVNSYENNFKDLPPHPKQSRLQKELIKHIMNGKKGLIFVRRIASATEIRDRLLFEYEKTIIQPKLVEFSKNKNLKSNKLQKLVTEFNDKDVFLQRRDLFKELNKRKEISKFLKQQSPPILEDQFVAHLCYILDEELCPDSDFRELYKYHINKGLKNVSKELKQATIQVIKETIDIVKLNNSDTVVDTESEPYFFNAYFRKGNPGFSYRTKMYRENWFELNFIELNNHFEIIPLSGEMINSLESKLYNIKVDDKKKNQLFADIHEVIFKTIKKSTKNSNHKIKFELENTFLTQFLIKYCKSEFELWVSKRKDKAAPAIITDFRILAEILKGIYRNGLGLLTGFIASESELPFTDAMFQIFSQQNSHFKLIIKECKTILQDFDLIKMVNGLRQTDDFEGLKREIQEVFKNLSPIFSATGQDKLNKSLVAKKFRFPGYPYILITTDILREGEDLHTYCQDVYHYGIAWNPSDMEQRTGRIDRINSLSYRMLNEQDEINFDNKIQIFYPYIQKSVEVNQVMSLLDNLDLFIRTFNDIEEDVNYSSQIETSTMHRSDEIPKQIDTKLTSKYDYDKFEG